MSATSQISAPFHSGPADQLGEEAYQVGAGGIDPNLVPLLLADSRRIEMDYGEARATIDGDTVTTIVVFGEDEAPPLLGAYTLEGLALVVDPEAQRLVPTHMILY